MGCQKLTYPHQNLKLIWSKNHSEKQQKFGHPFGMLMPGRHSTSESYRYGFNGMEKDDEVKGISGGSYTTPFRQYDPRLGRWMSTDPITQPWQSPYCAFDDNPVYYADPSGLKAGNGVLSPRQLKRAKRRADRYAEKHGIENYSVDERGWMKWGHGSGDDFTIQTRDTKIGRRLYAKINNFYNKRGSESGSSLMGDDICFDCHTEVWDVGPISGINIPGYLVWGNGSGGQETYGSSLFNYKSIKTIELSELEDLISISHSPSGKIKKSYIKKGNTGTGSKASGKLDTDVNKPLKAASKALGTEEAKNESGGGIYNPVFSKTNSEYIDSNLVEVEENGMRYTYLRHPDSTGHPKYSGGSRLIKVEKIK